MPISHLDEFERLLQPEERRLWESLNTPRAIQDFLDSTRYPEGEANRSVLRVLRDREAHCLDGGIFAAAALRRLGHPPILVDLLPEPGADDDHILAIFRDGTSWGAVAKSNFSGLRFREAVYGTLRELVMSYFDFYFNRHGQKTLRASTRPIYLNRYDHLRWMTQDYGVDAFEVRLKHFTPFPLLTPAQAARLTPVDPLVYQAGMLGTNQSGLYQPRPKNPS
jgi:hypothetical protein